MVISAHGNSLRALVKYLDNIPDSEITELNIPTGKIIMPPVTQWRPGWPNG